MKRLALVLGLLAASAPNAIAQTTIGVSGGPVAATMTTETQGATLDFGYRTSYRIGTFFEQHWASSPLGLRFELGYANRGGTWDALTIDLDYLDAGAFIKVGRKYYLLAGGIVSQNAGCRFVARGEELDCDEAARLAGADFAFTNMVPSVVAGIGAADRFGRGDFGWVAEIRATHSLAAAVEHSTSKNLDFGLSLGVTYWPGSDNRATVVPVSVATRAVPEPQWQSATVERVRPASPSCTVDNWVWTGVSGMLGIHGNVFGGNFDTIHIRAMSPHGVLLGTGSGKIVGKAFDVFFDSVPAITGRHVNIRYYCSNEGTS